MTRDKALFRLEEFSRALTRLEEAVTQRGGGDLLRDATVQRFEFTYELAWKTLKAFLEIKGKDAPFPRDCFKNAYRAGWIDDETLWLDMLRDRNLTSHIYKEKEVIEIAARIPSYNAALHALHKKLSEVLMENNE